MRYANKYMTRFSALLLIFISSVVRATPLPMRSNDFCEVDSSGRILSVDKIQKGDGKKVQVTLGGCVERPIRETWAVTLNHSLLKPDSVDATVVSEKPGLEDSQVGIYFVFDIKSVVHVLGGLMNPEWTTRWSHVIRRGNWAAPEEIVIPFEKINGTSHIALIKGTITLEQVTDRVTSFIVSEEVQADRYHLENLDEDSRRLLSKLRNGSPNWKALSQKD